MENIVSKRLNQLDDLRYSENPEEFSEELEDFTTDFTHMKRKEAAVMNAIPENIRLNESFDKLKEIKDEFDSFMEKRYSLKKKIGEIEQLEDKRSRILGDIEEKKNKLEDLDSEKTESKLEEVKEEISELDSSEVWKEYEKCQEEIDEAKANLVELENEEGKAVNKMERGLKKLIYRIEETDLEFNGDLDLLKKMRDGKKSEIAEYTADEIKTTAKEALESLPDGLLSDSQEKKFVEAVQTLGNLDELREKIEEERKKIEELEEQIENHEAIERKEELERRRDELQEELKEIREDKNRMEESLEKLREDLEETEQELRGKIKDAAEREIKFRRKTEKDKDKESRDNIQN